MFARTNSPLSLVLIAALSIVALTVIGVREFPPASAGAPLVVTKNADTNDGTCDAADCSLREAIIAANANAGADTITLPAGTYTLSIAGTGENDAATGDLDIRDDLTLNGAGQATTIIDAAALDRVFDVDPAPFPTLPLGINVTISDVTITGGNPGDAGGGIRNEGNVTLESVTVSGNETDAFNRAGGGIINQESATMTINRSDIKNNNASGGGGGSTGGGVQNANAADITITNTVITNNKAYSGGGFNNSNGATASISESTVSDNTATTSDGGGISVTQGTAMTISNTTIKGNTAASGGGGVSSIQSGILTIRGSTIRGNTAEDGAGVHQDGGDEARTTITNSTITGNNATGNGGGIGRFGDGVVNLNNLTITDNTADSDSAGGGDGGGIANLDAGVINLKNTIVSGNFDPTSDPDCFGTLTSQGYNLIQNLSAGCTIAGDTTGNVTGADPLLMPLAANGGPTDNHAIPAGSPAVDAGNPADPGSGGDACEAADQRGVSRPLDGDADNTALCDIGAYEAPGDPPTPTPITTSTPSPTATPTPSPTGSPTPTPTSTPPAPADALWGDNDCDIDADAVDALKGLQKVAAIEFTQNEPCPDLGSDQQIKPAGFGVKTWGDVDCDGDIDAVDALGILRFVVAFVPLAQTPPCPAIGDPIIFG